MNLKDKIYRRIYPLAESVFRRIEASEFSRGSNLLRIPPRPSRSGGLGTTSYGEWCYTIGMFQALIGVNLKMRPVSILDVGCGVGRLYMAAKPFLTEVDSFVGIDISEKSIRICKDLFEVSGVDFIHTPARNAYYSNSEVNKSHWPFPDASKNLITALSVWTHLNETDWKFYLSEVARVLQPGGCAIISFFILDDFYQPEIKTSQESRFYPQPENKWIFDKPAYSSADWFCPSWASVPEVAIGVRKHAFDLAVGSAGLKLKSFFPGQWKDYPGLFFQDICILEKA